MGVNAQTSVPAFTAGQVLTAAEMTEVNTGIPVFATTVTRDAAFGGTGLKVLAQGQYAYIEATSTLQVYTGSAWITANNGFTLVATATFSAVNTVSINNCFTSNYENYFITFTKSASVGTNSNLTLRLRASATDSTTNYKTQRFSANGTNLNGITDPQGTDEWQIGFTNAANVSECYAINIFAPQTTSTTRYLTNSFFQLNDGTVNSYFLAGFNSASASYDGFTILTEGTSISGVIRVYGYANS